MGKNAREGSLGKTHVVAAAIRVAGVPVIEQGFVGIPETDAASGVTYTLDHRVGAYHIITKVGAEAKGDFVYLTAATNAITLAAGVGKRLFAQVVEAENGTIYGTPAGKTLIALMPQTVTP